MKIIKQYIVSIERIMLSVYLIILLFALLGIGEIFFNVTFIAVIAIFWPPSFLSSLMPTFYSAVIYYFILFAIPILGIYFSKRKNINLHLSLLITLLLILGLHLYLVYEAWKI